MTCLRTLLRGALFWLLRPRILGAVETLRAGPLLILANHPSWLDALLLGLLLPLRTTVVLHPDELRNRGLRLLPRCIDCVAVDLSTPQSVKPLIRLLASGRAVVVFPEARVSATGALMKLYDVPALVAARTAVQIVPVHIDGVAQSRFGGTGAHRQLVGRVRLTIGRAAQVTAATGLPARERRRRAARDLLKIMQRLDVDARAPTTLFDALLAAAATHGAGLRVLEDSTGAEYSYGRLLRTSIGLGWLASRLSAEREVVGVLLPNLGVTVCAVFGLTAYRRVPAMLNYSAGPGALAAACRAAAIKTVISSRSFIDSARLHHLLPALERVRLVYLEDLRAQLRWPDRVRVAWARRFPRSALPPAAPALAAVVLFTSGSEGAPKGVALSHAAILAGIAQIRAVIDVRHDDKFLSALPLYHTYGLNACTILPLLSGTRLYLHTNPLHYRAIPEIAYRRDCTYLFGTSTFLAQYARSARPYDFRSIRYVISGGEKLEAEVARAWSEKFGLRIIEGYGATECGPAMTLNSPLDFRAGTVGRFLPGIETCVVPVAGVPRGGVLHVRGPNLMLGYYLREQPGVLVPPRSGLGEGWYATGDMVDIDDDGFAIMLGRAKRFAKVAGEMVSLELVERIALRASPGHRHAALVQAIADRGESTVLFTTDPVLDRIRLHRAAVELGCQELAVARRIEFVPELPVLGSGKIDYVALRNRALAAAAAGRSTH